MSKSIRPGHNLRQPVSTKVKGLQKKSLYTLAALILIASGGYYTGSDRKVIEIEYNELGTEQFYHVLDSSEKKGMILFYTAYCFPCKNLNDTLSINDEVVSAINQSFVPYKIDVFEEEVGPVLMEKYKIDELPTLIMTDQNGSEIGRTSEIWNKIDLTSILAKTPSGEEELVYTRKDSLGSVSRSQAYSLLLQTFDTYEEARSSAALRANLWAGDLWIEENPTGTYELILGLFEEKKEALLAQNYLESWEGIESEIRHLSERPQRYR